MPYLCWVWPRRDCPTWPLVAIAKETCNLRHLHSHQDMHTKCFGPRGIVLGYSPGKFFFRTRRFLVACKPQCVMADVTSGDAQQCQAEEFVLPLPRAWPSGARRRRGFSPELPRATRSQANQEDSAFFSFFSSCGTAWKIKLRRRCDVVFKIRRFARVAGKILKLDKTFKKRAL